MKVSQRTPPVCLISKRFFETSENIKMNKIPRILCLLKSYQWVIFIGFPIQISRPLNSVGSGHPWGPPYRRSLSSNRLFEKCFSFTKFLLDFFRWRKPCTTKWSPMYDMLEPCIFIRRRTRRFTLAKCWPFIFSWYHQSPKTPNKTCD